MALALLPSKTSPRILAAVAGMKPESKEGSGPALGACGHGEWDTSRIVASTNRARNKICFSKALRTAGPARTCLRNCHSPWSEALSEKRTAQGRTSAQGGSEEQTVRSGAGAQGSRTPECAAPSRDLRAAGAGLRASRGRRRRRTQTPEDADPGGLRGADRVSSGDSPGHVGSGQPPPPPPAPPPALCSSAFTPLHGRAAHACPSRRSPGGRLNPAQLRPPPRESPQWLPPPGPRAASPVQSEEVEESQRVSPKPRNPASKGARPPALPPPLARSPPPPPPPPPPPLPGPSSWPF
ncbi:basic proline-rich protein-like [Eubalaena glacialis]|uniref:basic proline-rich protein-like n=1 Tax=Eubalaena glacialis TaxID=27606 RepID=UPI002A5A1881|nr:basic proline-rich protein-like [Eubalaena glacialis]